VSSQNSLNPFDKSKDRTGSFEFSLKPSGLDWLGDIPAHWTIERAKNVFSVRDERSERGDEELLSVSHITGVTSRADKEVYMFKADDMTGYKRCYPNDLVINTLWAWMGAMGVSPLEGIVSPDYHVYKSKGLLLPEFIELLCRSKPFIAEVNRWSKGVWSSRLRLYPENFFEIRLPIPPKGEQQDIIEYIDRETAHIDALIAEKKHMLELLVEKRLSLVHDIISHADTKMTRIRHCAERVFRPIERLEDETYIPVGLYNRGRGVFHKDTTLGRNLGDSEFFYIREGDLILSGQFAWEGSVAMASQAEEGCVVSHRYHVFRGREGKLDTTYFWAYLTTKIGDFVLQDHSRGSAGRNRPLNPNTLEKEKIPLPPIDLQLKVANLVRYEQRLKLVIAESEALLNERRQNLITAAVAGQIDSKEMIV